MFAVANVARRVNATKVTNDLTRPIVFEFKTNLEITFRDTALLENEMKERAETSCCDQ